MKYALSKRAFLAGSLSVLTSGAVWAKAPAASLRPVPRPANAAKRSVPDPKSLIAQAKLGGRVVYAVADAKTGARLEGNLPTTQVAPASVAKAVTALYALDALGADHRFQTRLMATGAVSNCVLGGDLILVGGGDPTLDTNHLADMARQLKAAGVREVRGAFKVFEGALPFIKTIDTDQPDHVGYSPAVSGISLNYNRVHFEWRRNSGKYSISMDARSDKYRPDVTMAQMRIADRSLPVYAYADQKGRDAWSVSRGALGNAGSRWLPVRKPAAYAGDVFRSMAASQGIRLKTAEVVRRAPQGAVLVTQRSEPLREILRDMLRFSTNLTAEMVGMAATSKRKGVPSGLRASASEMNAWAKSSLGVSGMNLRDHSGLGAANRMSADAMVDTLVKVFASDSLRTILKPVAMRDSKGRVLKNHPIAVNAKTGTLNFVSGLGGYMEAKDGSVLAFAIFSGDEAVRKRIKKANREAPQGARGYNKRAKRLQQQLIERWGTLYGS
jgi:D-alanyl-D-alanine carboxypeptidase/D-alanyl-D-alanine-endopeptidase (penicillin-binding protein 4)